MESAWPEQKCILCLREEEKLSRAHLFPEMLGGFLWSRTHCKDCNSFFGHEVAPAARQRRRSKRGVRRPKACLGERRKRSATDPQLRISPKECPRRPTDGLLLVAKVLAPRLLVRDRNSKFTPNFDELFRCEGIRVIKARAQAPSAWSPAARRVGTARGRAPRPIADYRPPRPRHMVREHALYYNTRIGPIARLISDAAGQAPVDESAHLLLPQLDFSAVESGPASALPRHALLLELCARFTVWASCPTHRRCERG
jgi:HNH endonuclease